MFFSRACSGSRGHRCYTSVRPTRRSADGRWFCNPFGPTDHVRPGTANYWSPAIISHVSIGGLQYYACNYTEISNPAVSQKSTEVQSRCLLANTGNAYDIRCLVFEMFGLTNVRSNNESKAWFGPEGYPESSVSSVFAPVLGFTVRGRVKSNAVLSNVMKTGHETGSEFRTTDSPLNA